MTGGCFRFRAGSAVLQAEPYVGGTFLLVNGGNVFAGSVELTIEALEDVFE